jgi:signal transduction histidine kinase
MNDFLILLLASESDLIMPFVELLTIISILFFIISFGGIFYIKNKRAADRLEEENQKEILITKIISQVQENERNRIARDLHDTVIQDTRTALLYARQLEQYKESSDGAEAAEKIRMLEERNMLNIRSIIRNLNPPEIESAEFEHLIKDFARNAQEMSGIDFKVYTQASDYLKKLSFEQKLHIYRIIQESVNNAIKHASPSEISIIVREEENKSDNKNSKSLVFIISDDGKGFDGDVPASESEEDKLTETGTHLGLRGMKSRALILGAELSIKSSQDWGTQIKLTIKITD